jgi:hypothetical protein
MQFYSCQLVSPKRFNVLRSMNGFNQTFDASNKFLLIYFMLICSTDFSTASATNICVTDEIMWFGF